ncbi:MAG: methyltransferase domain-containing protein [Candidatus Bathyarchaeota archaeon]|nr:MAG: methyltransferase domain-containing protein [Candidatus Bathyarchaeota archaeon]
MPKRLAASGAVEIAVKLGSISGGRVLDVATESGDFINSLMKTLKAYDYFIGIDISKKALETARKRFAGQPVKLVEMNAELLEFDNESFDTVCMAYSLHHLNRIDKVLTEMHRVLKPGGHLIIQEEFRDGKQTEAQTTNILQHAWDAQIDSLLGETHKMTFTKDKVEEIIGSLQLERVETFESTRPLFCLFCEKALGCEDPKWERTLKGSLEEIDAGLKRLAEVADPKARIRLQKQGEELKERNRKFGNESPSQLFAIGEKA